jgi:alkaline phosphatase D
MGLIRQTRANAVVVSGDSHAFWANELWDADTGGRRCAVEFGTAGISAPGPGLSMPGAPLGEAFVKHNREVLFNDQTANGFVRLTLTRTQALGELIAVSTTRDKAFATKVLAAYRATPGQAGVSGLKEAKAALPPRQRQAHAEA